jgi:hypothetical protein
MPRAQSALRVDDGFDALCSLGRCVGGATAAPSTNPTTAHACLRCPHSSPFLLFLSAKSRVVTNRSYSGLRSA